MTAARGAGGRASPAVAAIWELLLAARRHAAGAGAGRALLAVDRHGRVGEGTLADPLAAVELGAGGWRVTASPGADHPHARSLLALYLPVCAASRARPLLVAHLGQSLDGHIATLDGDSCYVTGPGNLDHLHRMRALSDAIVVGAGTVAADDPRLTTRRVPGPSPVRVVIDPDRRLDSSLGLFRDGDAETIVVQAGSEPTPTAVDRGSTIVVPRVGAGIDLAAMLAALRARGFGSVFVEGGGRTVSALLEADLVDRLQIAVAPLVTGRGRRGLDLPARSALADALRPASRLFAMGDDVLFDCDLRAARAGDPADPLPRLIG